MFTSWGQILWPLDYRFALKNNLCRSAYTIPLVIALIMVWKTKDAALRKKIHNQRPVHQ
jgi:inner membrane protein